MMNPGRVELVCFLLYSGCNIVLLLYFRSLYPHPWICHVLAIPRQIYQVFKFKVYLSSLDYLS